ncbi:ABC transporter permease [Photorhabdus tasmaniensis]|uniref:ABC transporter permease n=1 Tax=Photorhabdus tasmaniensis TaxID=1004159 RepID=UPI00404305F3
MIEQVFKKFMKVSSLGIQQSLEYRTDFFVSLISVPIIVVVQYYFWKAVYTNSNEVFTYSFNQMIFYILTAQLISKVVSSGFEDEIQHDIKNGGLNKYIVIPMSYTLYHFSKFIGGKLLQTALVGTILSFIIVSFYLETGNQIELNRLVLFILSIINAFLLTFSFYFTLAALCFYFHELGYFFMALRLITGVASGALFPLHIFGKEAFEAMKFLPFMYMINFPVNIIYEKISISDTIFGVLTSFVWILILFSMMILVWKTSSNKYISAGGG